MKRKQKSKTWKDVMKKAKTFKVTVKPIDNTELLILEPFLLTEKQN
jgi:hypothetical protein